MQAKLEIRGIEGFFAANRWRNTTRRRRNIASDALDAIYIGERHVTRRAAAAAYCFPRQRLFTDSGQSRIGTEARLVGGVVPAAGSAGADRFGNRIAVRIETTQVLNDTTDL